MPSLQTCPLGRAEWFTSLLDEGFIEVIPSHRENTVPSSDLHSDFPSIWGSLVLSGLHPHPAASVPVSRVHSPLTHQPHSEDKSPGGSTEPLASAREWGASDRKKRWGRVTDSGLANLSPENDSRLKWWVSGKRDMPGSTQRVRVSS